MIQRLRSHLTYANVMVTILAFIVLGGGTALASFVVSSNSQVGPGTISGHKPPSGDHANIIAGSINGADLANNAVTGIEARRGREVRKAHRGGQLHQGPLAWRTHGALSVQVQRHHARVQPDADRYNHRQPRLDHTRIHQWDAGLRELLPRLGRRFPEGRAV